ncbi:hypothetical protein CC78DRAFT_621067 [Lojkania enalia]|uniref:Uncharacterized protein n=1 Tax=Lojkania enalia TaxID=147567 RepID=A0A9P4K268_9PLEO|nr:hypothetical protein CC78DRAFT_621067 [Didymosphaeria enalia]
MPWEYSPRVNTRNSFDWGLEREEICGPKGVRLPNFKEQKEWDAQIVLKIIESHLQNEVKYIGHIPLQHLKFSFDKSKLIAGVNPQDPSQPITYSAEDSELACQILDGIRISLRTSLIIKFDSNTPESKLNEDEDERDEYEDIGISWRILDCENILRHDFKCEVLDFQQSLRERLMEPPISKFHGHMPPNNRRAGDRIAAKD